MPLQSPDRGVSWLQQLGQCDSDTDDTYMALLPLHISGANKRAGGSEVGREIKGSGLQTQFHHRQLDLPTASTLALNGR